MKRKCIFCGSFDVVEEEDKKAKPIAYHPMRIYPKKYTCKKCRKEFTKDELLEHLGEKKSTDLEEETEEEESEEEDEEKRDFVAPSLEELKRRRAQAEGEEEEEEGDEDEDVEIPSTWKRKCYHCGSFAVSEEDDKDKKPIAFFSGKAIYPKKYLCKKCGKYTTKRDIIKSLKESGEWSSKKEAGDVEAEGEEIQAEIEELPELETLESAGIGPPVEEPPEDTTGEYKPLTIVPRKSIEDITAKKAKKTAKTAKPPKTVTPLVKPQVGIESAPAEKAPPALKPLKPLKPMKPKGTTKPMKPQKASPVQKPVKQPSGEAIPTPLPKIKPPWKKTTGLPKPRGKLPKPKPKPKRMGPTLDQIKAMTPDEKLMSFLVECSDFFDDMATSKSHKNIIWESSMEELYDSLKDIKIIFDKNVERAIQWFKIVIQKTEELEQTVLQYNDMIKEKDGFNLDETWKEINSIMRSLKLQANIIKKNL
ncbi:MAG: hypothetical protein ACFFCS_01380 [Candidatus Hodarchaeota archaeon]